VVGRLLSATSRQRARSTVSTQANDHGGQATPTGLLTAHRVRAQCTWTGCGRIAPCHRLQGMGHPFSSSVSSA